MASIFLLVENVLACSLVEIPAAFCMQFTSLGRSLLRDTPFTCTFCECSSAHETFIVLPCSCAAAQQQGEGSTVHAKPAAHHGPSDRLTEVNAAWLHDSVACMSRLQCFCHATFSDKARLIQLDGTCIWQLAQ